ncbi:TPA: hypothetical protein ACH3X2_004766 [Trebouxia sp. C0005]
MHCSTGQGNIYSPVFSAMQNSLSQHAMCHGNYTYGERLFIQVCRAGQGKIYNCSGQNAQLLKAVVLNRLPALLCHWLYIYGALNTARKLQNASGTASRCRHEPSRNSSLSSCTPSSVPPDQIGSGLHYQSLQGNNVI